MTNHIERLRYNGRESVAKAQGSTPIFGESILNSSAESKYRQVNNPNAAN